MVDLLLEVHAMGVPLVTLAWVMPLVLAVLVARQTRPAVRLGLSLLGSGVLLAVAVVAGFGWMRMGEGMVLEEHLSLGPLNYHVGLDGLGVVFVAFAQLLALLVTVYGWIADKPRLAVWQAWGLVLLSSLIGMIVSLDLIQFAAFALLEIVPAAALVRGWGTSDAKRQAADGMVRFLLLSVGLWLAGAAVLAWQASLGPVGFTTDLIALRGLRIASPWGDIAFFLLLYAMAVRLPLFPFHAWLPPVIEHGPVVGLNVFLLGMKVGAFGLVRFVLPLVPDAAMEWSVWVSALGLLGMLYGALVSFAQRDLRRMIAFAALSHMGFVVPGLFTLTVHGVEGAMLEVLNLGLASAGLYFVVGFLHLRTGSTHLSDLRGVGSGVPMLATMFLVIALASIGMPGTSGSEGLHLVLEGAIDAHRYGTAVGVGLGTVLAAAVLLYVYQHVLIAQEGTSRALRDLDGRELAIALVLCGAIFGIGLYADPWLDALHGSADTVAHGSDTAEAALWPHQEVPE